MSKAIHLGCGGEIVAEGEDARVTIFGTMFVPRAVSPWCRKCGYKVREEFIVYPDAPPVLSPEEGRGVREKMAREYPWLESGENYGRKP